MSQSDYSAIILDYLKTNHPEFLSTVVFNEDQSFECHIKSPKGSILLWLKTWGAIITLEFELQDKSKSWHTHMNLVGNRDSNQSLSAEEELAEMTMYLRAIYSGMALMAFDSDGDFYITEDPGQDLTELTYGEPISLKAWCDL